MILRKGTFSPSAGPQLYAGVARDFERWLARGVLVRDNQPAYYLYRQSFSLGRSRVSRTGLFVLLELGGYGRRILPHERTLAGPKKDRLRLLKATHANFSAIFGLHSDPRRQVARITRPFLKKRPVLSVRGRDGVLNRLWVIRDPRTIRRISQVLGPKRIWIADGHHRFETALAFSRWARSQRLRVNAGHTLACLVAMEDPGCRILAIHRLVRIARRTDRDALMKGLVRRFDVRRVANLKPLIRTLERPSPLQRVGIYDGRNYYLLSAGRRRSGRLDAEFLNRKILDPLIRRLHLRRGYEIQFEHDPDCAKDRVNRHEYHLCFFLAPTRLSDMKRLTAAGKRMPEKSTYFYPKILSGLVMNKFEKV